MRQALILGTVAVLALLVPACSDDSESTKQTSSSSERAETEQTDTSADAVVEIRGTALHPDNVTIKVGGTVTWKFVDDGVVHDIKGAIFGSGPKSTGDYEFAFPDAGTSTYHCTIHPDMKGVVNVTA